MKNPEDLISASLSGCPWARQQQATAYAPANIALCKYWGKRDRTLNLPVTDSLSISLGPLGSHCKLSLAPADAYFLGGKSIAPDNPFAVRLRTFLNRFRGPDDYHYRVEAINTVATGAGFASSASGFAALVLALHELHGWGLDAPTLSSLARMGSGSACRSLWDGFVHWRAGSSPDGIDSYAMPLDTVWRTLRIGLLTIDAGVKPVSSREAMQRTVETSALYAGWPQQVQKDMDTLLAAIEARDFAALGACAEQNCLAMHATMLAARPTVMYWQPASLQRMQEVWQARAEGLPVYFTMDAGPNIKLLFEEGSQAEILARFPGLRVADPWGPHPGHSAI